MIAPKNPANAAVATATAQVTRSPSHEQFMQLMLKELTHQDPLKPMSSAEMAQQMLNLEQIKSSETLQNKLENLSHALMLGSSHLIGRLVSVRDVHSDQDLQGVVQALRTHNGQFEVVIGGQSYSTESLREIH